MVGNSPRGAAAVPCLCLHAQHARMHACTHACIRAHAHLAANEGGTCCACCPQKQADSGALLPRTRFPRVLQHQGRGLPALPVLRPPPFSTHTLPALGDDPPAATTYLAASTGRGAQCQGMHLVYVHTSSAQPFALRGSECPQLALCAARVGGLLEQVRWCGWAGGASSLALQQSTGLLACPSPPAGCCWPPATPASL